MARYELPPSEEQDTYSESINNRIVEGSSDGAKNRRWAKRILPVVLGVAAMFGGENTAIAQQTAPEQNQQKIELSREFSESLFGLGEITKEARSIMLDRNAGEAEKQKQKLVIKYGQSAVDFGFQFEREKISEENAMADKDALAGKRDPASLKKMSELDAIEGNLWSQHNIEVAALESLLKGPAVDNNMGAQHFKVRIQHVNGAPFDENASTTTTDRTIQVGYEKYQAPTGESEAVTDEKMEEMLNRYLKNQGMDFRSLRTKYSFKYLVKDPSSPSEHPTYLLVESVADAPAESKTAPLW